MKFDDHLSETVLNSLIYLYMLIQNIMKVLFDSSPEGFGGIKLRRNGRPKYRMNFKFFQQSDCIRSFVCTVIAHKQIDRIIE